MCSSGKFELLAGSLADDFAQLELVLRIFISEIITSLPDFSTELTQRQRTVCQTLETGFDELRMAVERHRPRATAIMERLQAIIARDVIRRSQGPGRLILMEILQEAKVEILPILRRALDEFPCTNAGSEISSQEQAVLQGQEMLKKLEAQRANDIFGLAHDLSSPMESLSPQNRSEALMMSLALAQEPSSRDLVGLFCLDKDSAVRKSFLELLAQTGANLGTGNTLRRLIVLRSWLPAAERPLVDEAVRSLRIAGVECAPLMPAKHCELVSSCVDGSGAWGLLGCAKSGSNALIFGLVCRVKYGICDAWTKNQAAKSQLRDMEAQMKGINKEIGGSVSTKTAMLLVRHAITTGLKEGRTPSMDVLEISEILGCQEWLNPESSLEGEINNLREYLHGKKDLTKLRQKVLSSDDWWKYPVFESWFEDDAAVDVVVQETFGSRLKILRPTPELMALAVEKVLTEVIARRIEKWRECLLLLAFLSAEMKSRNFPAASECLILSDYLNAGGEVHKLPFFHWVALRSVAASVARLQSGRGV